MLCTRSHKASAVVVREQLQKHPVLARYVEAVAASTRTTTLRGPPPPRPRWRRDPDGDSAERCWLPAPAALLSVWMVKDATRPLAWTQGIWDPCHFCQSAVAAAHACTHKRMPCPLSFNAGMLPPATRHRSQMIPLWMYLTRLGASMFACHDHEFGEVR